MADFENSCIYVIRCNDVNIRESYIGSTTNIANRKACHRYACTVEHAPGYNYKLYRFIRENGGFDNWTFTVIERPAVETRRELHLVEKFWVTLWHPELNKNVPGRDPICEHGRHRVQCHRCDGSSICVHGRKKSQCCQCNGTSICPHNKKREQCKLCSPAKCQRCDKLYSKQTIKQHLKTCKG